MDKAEREPKTLRSREREKGRERECVCVIRKGLPQPCSPVSRLHWITDPGRNVSSLLPWMAPDTFMGGVLCSFEIHTLMRDPGDNFRDIKFLGLDPRG